MAEISVEREYELRQMDFALRAARAGQGGLLPILGPPGIGTSELLDSTRVWAGELGFKRLPLVACSPPDALVPLGVVHRLFGEDVDDVVAHVSGLSEPEPLFIGIDDLQWCDDPSLRVLEELANGLEHVRCTLAVATRVSYGELIAAPHIEYLHPSPLTVDGVREKLGTDVPADVAAAIREAAGGLPFYVEAVAHEWRLSGEVVAEPRGIPQRVLARQSDYEIELASAGAVLGMEFHLSLAGSLASQAPDDALFTMSRLVDEGLLLRGDWPERKEEIRWVHALFREAVYDDLEPEKRMEFHRDAARVLEGTGGPLHLVEWHRRRGA